MLVIFSPNKLGSTERGAALLELALCLPVLIIISIGIIKYGFGLRHAQIIADAARSGARAGARVMTPTQGPPGCNDCTCVQNEAQTTTNNYIQNAGLVGNTFSVEVDAVCLLVLAVEDPDDQGTPVIRVMVTRLAQGGLFEASTSIIPFFPSSIQASATFALERSCTPPDFPPPVCL